MTETAEYRQDYGDVYGKRSKCLIRVYIPDDWDEAKVVVCSALPGDTEVSITQGAQTIAAAVVERHGRDPLIWIEHYPPETTADNEETWDLVVFADFHPVVGSVDDYRVAEIGGGGHTKRKRIDRATAETLFGSPL